MSGRPRLGALHRPRLLRRPEQGWASLALLTAMLFVVGVSIADARPLVVGETNLSGSLVTLIVTAGLVGFVLARSSLGVIRAHLVGAAVAAAILLLLVGGAVTGDGRVTVTDWPELTRRIEALYGVLQGSMIQEGTGEVRAPPTAATFLLLGALCWTTGQFAAFTVFRYERAGPAVMATGILLFLNVALRALAPDGFPLSLLGVLALYSMLAMLLLLRLQLQQQGRQWARRHISDTGEVARLFLRTGVIFVAVSVAGASSLTLVAAAPVPDIDPGGLEEPLRDLGEELSRLLSWLDVPDRAADTRYPDRIDVGDRWTPGTGTAFTARVDGSLRANYWWGTAMAEFDGTGWSAGPSDEEGIDEREPLSLGRSSRPEITFPLELAIEPADSALARGTALAPSEAQLLDRDVEVTTVRGGNGLVDITFEDPVPQGEAYRVTSVVADYRPRTRSFSQTALRAAGDDYPDWVLRHYAGDPREHIGRETIQLVASIRDKVQRDGSDTPFDRAVELQEYLRGMRYDTDIAGDCDEATGVAECLLEIERGFCQHFATTMVLALREMDIPARYVSGFLPGEETDDGLWTVPMQAAHAWVEVYFPGFGWVRFDPTPGSRLVQFGQQATELPQGPGPTQSPESEPVPSETPVPTSGPAETLEPSPSPGPVAAEGGVLQGGGGLLAIGLGVAGLAALVLAAVGALLFVRLRRLPGADGTLAYRGIAGLAARLGYGPHPSQTEYEFAASLSEVVPGVRDDLYLVAGVSVESAYGRRRPSSEGLAALRRSYARIRMALVRLLLRGGR